MLICCLIKDADKQLFIIGVYFRNCTRQKSRELYKRSMVKSQIERESLEIKNEIHYGTVDK